MKREIKDIVYSDVYRGIYDNWPTVRGHIITPVYIQIWRVLSHDPSLGCGSLIGTQIRETTQ